MKLPKIIPAIALAASICAPAAAATGPEIDAFFKDLSGKMDLSKAGIALVDLADPANPARGGWQENEIRPAASCIKLNLLASAYNAAAHGVSMDTELKITKNNWTGTWDPNEDGIADPNPPIKLGETWTLGRLTEVMVRRSDNVATNTLMDFLDRKKVTEFSQSIGMANTYVRHKLSSGTDVDDPDATGYNQMPPHDAATLLMQVAQGTLVSPEASAAMYDTLAGQLDRELIGEGIGKDAAYAGKTGEISAARNDAAIVRGPGRQYVLVVYMQLPGGQAKPIIQKIAAAVDAFLTPRGRS